jgi:uncharacterized RDD family membrane protein YckC
MASALPRGIVTPEAVVLEFETAGLASRGVARLIDAAIQGAILLAIVLVAANVEGWVGIVLLVSGLAGTLLGYPAACELLMQGRSPGKAAFGLRVVTVEGGPIAARHAFTRSALGLVDFLLPPGGLFAVVSSLLSARSQRFGDLVAGTMVLRERSAAPTAAAVWFNPPHGLEGYAATLDVSQVDDAQFAIVRSFLVRVHELAPEARSALALRLARPIAAAMHHTPPAGVHPELFLVCVAAAHQRRHQPDGRPTGPLAPAGQSSLPPPPPPPPHAAPPPPPASAPPPAREPAPVPGEPGDGFAPPS